MNRGNSSTSATYATTQPLTQLALKFKDSFVCPLEIDDVNERLMIDKMFANLSFVMSKLDEIVTCQHNNEIHKTRVVINIAAKIEAVLDKEIDSYNLLKTQGAMSDSLDDIYLLNIHIIGIIHFIAEAIENKKISNKDFNLLFDAIECLSPYDPFKGHFHEKMNAKLNALLKEASSVLQERRDIIGKLDVSPQSYVELLIEKLQPIHDILTHLSNQTLSPLERHANIIQLVDDYNALYIDMRNLPGAMEDTISLSKLKALHARLVCNVKSFVPVLQAVKFNPSAYEKDVKGDFTILFDKFEAHFVEVDEMRELFKSKKICDDLTNFAASIGEAFFTRKQLETDFEHLKSILDSYVELTSRMNRGLVDKKITNITENIIQLQNDIAQLKDRFETLLAPVEACGKKYSELKRFILKKLNAIDFKHIFKYGMAHRMLGVDGVEIDLNVLLSGELQRFTVLVTDLNLKRNKVLNDFRESSAIINGFHFDGESSERAVAKLGMDADQVDVMYDMGVIELLLSDDTLIDEGDSVNLSRPQLTHADLVLTEASEKIALLKIKHKEFSRQFMQAFEDNKNKINLTPAEQVCLHAYQCNHYLDYAEHKIRKLAGVNVDIKNQAYLAYHQMNTMKETKLSMLLVKYHMMSQAKETLLSGGSSPEQKVKAFDRFWLEKPAHAKVSHCKYMDMRRDSGLRTFFKVMLTIAGFGIPLAFLWNVQSANVQNSFRAISRRSVPVGQANHVASIGRAVRCQ